MNHLLLLSFCILFSNLSAQVITRGPYLQTPTSTEIIVIWRTDVSTTSTIWYGTDLNNLNLQSSSNLNATQHSIKLTGLQAYTKYYYSVGYGNNPLSVADTNHYFITAPLPYTEQNIRVWATGDFGRASQGQVETKQAFENFTRAQNIDPDMWLWLGDNAYDDGKDSEYQSNVFSVPNYSDIFSWLPFWPSPGNHDYNTIWSQNGILGIPYTLTSIGDHQGPYYDIVDVPEQAEAGGIASTHEVFYSFDYGNAHFLSLNSEVYAIGNNNVLNQMIAWIHQDLQQNDKDWVVAYWHQPPYSKGSHDSDDFYEDVMKDMREKILPVLELYDIDLVICGHSHVYERSYLIHGHYDYSNTLLPSMILDNSNGNKASGNAYIKNEMINQAQGTVYSVVGNSATTETTTASNHPVMSSFYNGSGNFGSLIVDIYKNELRGRHLNSSGQIIDDFSIIKQNMTIQASQDQIICENDSIWLYTQQFKGSDSVEFKWMPGNILADSVLVSPSNSTNYILQATDLLSGQITYDTTRVDVVNIPPFVNISENNGVLSTVAGYNYQWFLNGNAIPGATSFSLTAGQQGFYTVQVSGSSLCSLTSESYAYFDLEINISADQNNICLGDSIILFLQSSGGSDSINVSWLNFPGQALNFYYHPDSSVQILAQGIDYISGEVEYDTLNITVHPLPNEPIISQNSNVLSTDSNSSLTYQWYLNGSPISGANSFQLNINQSGVYYVLVTDSNACSSQSASLNLVYSSIAMNTLETMNFIVPNPNQGSFYIDKNVNFKNVQIFDFLGKEQDFVMNQNSEITLSNPKEGVYLVKLTLNEGFFIQKLIVKP